MHGDVGKGARALCAALISLVVGLGLVPLGASPAGAEDCPAIAGLHRFVWTGGAGTDDWDTPGNWSEHAVPGPAIPLGQPGAVPTDYACIPALEQGGAPSVVTLDHGGQGVEADLAVLRNLGTVTVGRGGKLFLYGPQPSTSKVLTLSGSTLGGTGQLTVTSVLNWTSLDNAQFPPEGAAATQTTRKLEYLSGGVSPQGPLSVAPGRTTIAVGAKLNVNGALGTCGPSRCGGVNLRDERIIDNAGTTTLSNAGFVSADYGTRFTNLPGGRFVIKNAFGYYQGFVDYYSAAGRSQFVNNGLISKVAPGASVIDARYSRTAQGSGITITKGTLSIVADSGVGVTRQARVSPGASFANGGCGGTQTNAFCTTPAATADDQNVSLVSLPPVGVSPPSDVLITEVSPPPPPPGYHNIPGGATDVQTPQAVATSAHPLVFVFLIDSTLVAGLGLAPGSVRVARDTATAPLPFCAASGPGPACMLPVQALPGGDLKVTVKSTSNSTYRRIYL
jgi:hypothetical protein